MKRITSLDFLRGFAILLMTVVHALLSVWNLIAVRDISEFGPIMLIVAGFLIILVHWRGVFIMVSAVVHTYVMSKDYKRGVSRKNILIKQLFSGLLLIIVGRIYSAFFTTWGIIDKWGRGEGWNWEHLRFVYFAEALQDIAWGVIVASIFFYFLSKNDGMYKMGRNIAIYGAIGLTIIFVSPLVQQGVSQLAGGDLTRSDYFMDTANEQPILRLILVLLGGREAPLFPMLGISFIGVAIGQIIIQKQPKKEHTSYAMLAGAVMIIYGGLHLVFITGLENLDPGFHVHPTWFVLLNSGLQLIGILVVIRKVEFNENLNVERWLNFSRYFRRWGLVSLTIFMYQILDFIPRNIFTWIFPIDLNERYSVGFGWTLLYTIVFVLMFEGIVRLWEKGKFIGTWEWIMVKIRTILSMKEKPADDPLNIKGIIYNVEPISFVKGKTIQKDENVHQEPVLEVITKNE